MIEFANELQKDINKIVGTLKSDEELNEVLKEDLQKKSSSFINTR